MLYFINVLYEFYIEDYFFYIYWKRNTWEIMINIFKKKYIEINNKVNKNNI